MMSGPFGSSQLFGVAADASYTIGNSVWFDNGGPDYLHRDSGDWGTPSSTTSGIISVWVKLGDLTQPTIFHTGPQEGTGNNEFHFDINGDGTWGISETTSGSEIYHKKTTAILRDPTAWYHLLAIINTNDDSAENRIKMFINGVRVTAFNTSTNPSSGATVRFTADENNRIAVRTTTAPSTSQYDGYMAEFVKLDGYNSYTEDNFGEFDANGIWIPKDPSSLTFGTNGCWLDFAVAPGTGDGAGTDVSGEDNHFTEVSMTSAQQTTDSPTDSGSDIGNYCTWNPLEIGDPANPTTFSNGNLTSDGSTNNHVTLGTIGVTSGKWYWEWKWVSGGTSGNKLTGIAYENVQRYYDGSPPADGYLGGDNKGWGYYANGTLYHNNSTSTYGDSYTTGDIIGVALDMENGAVWFSKNNTWQDSATVGEIEAGTTTNAAATGLSGTVLPAMSALDASVCNGYFGAGGFEYTPPTAFKKLNTANLSAPSITKPSDQFLPMLYEGNGGGQRVGNFIPFTDAYAVDNSCMFVSGDSDYLTRTPGTPSSVRIGTFSFWTKRGTLGAYETLLQQDWTASGNEAVLCRFNNDDTFLFRMETNAGAYIIDRSTKRVFKNPSSWVHIHVTWDTNQTDNTACTVTINGVALAATDFNSPANPGSGQDSGFPNTGKVAAIGRHQAQAASYLDGYLSEVVFIDGSQQAVSSFGQTDTSTNRWIPKDVSGLTFGDEGFYLEFGTAADLGDDTSGETNDWAESTDLGANNQTIDTPTKNFATLNPNQEVWNAAVTLTKGNLHGAGTTTDVTNNVGSTIGYLTSGKWILAVNPATKSSYRGDPYIFNENFSTATANPITSANAWGASFTGGTGFSVANLSTTNDRAFTMAAAAATDDLILLAVDIDALKVWFGWYDDSADATYWCGSATSFDGDPAAGTGQSFTLIGSTFNFGFQFYSGREADIDFGQSGLLDNVTIPTGFKFLNQDNLAANTAGITGFSWIKNRDAGDEHIWQDRVRGVYEYLESSSTDAEATDTNSVQRFLQQGVQIGNMDAVNTSAESFVLWQWVANGTGTANTDGTGIDSTVSANTTAGFSVVKYEGSGTAGNTVGHGLGAIPHFIIVKNYSSTGPGWYVYHQALGATKYIRLEGNSAAQTSSDSWNDGSPVFSTTTFTVGGGGSYINDSGDDHIAYCWTETEGYSKFGSYTGNGNADGAFVYLGFRPAFILIKGTSASRSWRIFDNKRLGYNRANDTLVANGNAAETTDAELDITAGGFKLRSSAQDVGEEEVHIYAAFAENPFGGSGVAQARAR
jgi:hypothetical protein